MIVMKLSDVAYLSCKGRYTFFRCGECVLKFVTSDRYEKYTAVKEWDPEHGYIVVDVKHNTIGIVEDYIDLLPMLDNLYIDAKKMLMPIKRVEVDYAEC